MTDQPTKLEILDLTAQIVSAHVSNNTIAAGDVPQFISDVYKSIAHIGDITPSQDKLIPAVAINQSIHDDYIVCLEDGKKLKMLKRHLKTAYDMTPQDYRDKWNLSPDYPMVAPNYAARRSNLAKEIGLGKRPEK